MIIQDQFGTGLLNTDNILGLDARENDNDGGYIVSTVPIWTSEPYCAIGIYATRQRAEEVLYSIRNAMKMGETVYIMPSE